MLLCTLRASPHCGNSEDVISKRTLVLIVPLDAWFRQFGGVTPIHANIHRSPIPYTREHFESVKAAGIRVVFSFEEAVPGALAKSVGLDWRPHFWLDDHPPKVEQMDKLIADYASVPLDVPILMHCKAGWGRAGSAVTCSLIAKHGFTAQGALDHFWARVPNARQVMESNGQAEFVRGFAARVKGRGL